MGPGGRIRRIRRRARATRIPVTRRAAQRLFARWWNRSRSGLHGVHSAEISPGDDVLIVGAGGVGLTTLAWALRKGGARVTVADPDPQRRETAARAGSDRCRRRRRRTPTPAATTPSSNAWVGPNSCRRASRRCGRGAASSISGACAEPTPIEPITALLKELTVRYSVAYPTRRFPGGHRRIRSRRDRPGADDRTDVRAGRTRRGVRRGARPGRCTGGCWSPSGVSCTFFIRACSAATPAITQRR